MKRQKLRDLGVKIGKLPTGEKNCITDVGSVRVGHVTLKEDGSRGEVIRTGVTAILPHGGNLFRQKVSAASFVINGFGKTTGLVQLDELGQIESPIMLTNTFGVPAVTEGTLLHMLEKTPEIGDTTGTINIVVGECNDSYLNSIRQLPVKREHAIEAIEGASRKAIEEGAVGAGTGMVCFGYKGGIGSSSRIVKYENEAFTVGCLVLSNFGKREDFRGWQYKIEEGKAEIPEPDYTTDGSIMMIIATDAPLSERQLKRVAKRTAMGLGRAGGHASHGSGDIAIAFSTAMTTEHVTEKVCESKSHLREDTALMNQLFQATAEVSEEAILNSLTKATTTDGRNGRVVEEMPYHIFKK